MIYANNLHLKENSESMNLTDICIFFLLFSYINVYSQPIYGDDEQ
jgi:hypothetical protein